MMNLQRWLGERRLRRHESSAKEIADLLQVVDRDLKDASITQLSADRRFATAYSAALQLATIVLRAAGYRTAGGGHHWMTFQALPRVMGDIEQERADYFDACRRKRNIADYDASGEIAEAEVRELNVEAALFRDEVLTWLREKHPDMVPPS